MIHLSVAFDPSLCLVGSSWAISFRTHALYFRDIFFIDFEVTFCPINFFCSLLKYFLIVIFLTLPSLFQWILGFNCVFSWVLHFLTFLVIVPWTGFKLLLYFLTLLLIVSICDIKILMSNIVFFLFIVGNSCFMTIIYFFFSKDFLILGLKKKLSEIFLFFLLLHLFFSLTCFSSLFHVARNHLMLGDLLLLNSKVIRS